MPKEHSTLNEGDAENGKKSSNAHKNYIWEDEATHYISNNLFHFHGCVWRKCTNFFVISKKIQFPVRKFEANDEKLLL